MENEKLPEEFKKKWVDALLSGKYKQGNFQLRRVDNTYCCLGVAAKVCGVKDNAITGEYGLSTVNQNYRKVPNIIKSGPNPIAHAFMVLNDNNVPFEVIAGVINEYL